jgi:DnaJ-class molecular chaperone
MTQFQIWLECGACEGYGTTAAPPRGCGECDGKGLTQIKDESFDSVEDLKADYPESTARNTSTGRWSRSGKSNSTISTLVRRGG